MEFKILSANGKSFSIKARRGDINWGGDSVTMFKIALSESDDDERVTDWVPSSLRAALDNVKERNAAKAAIADYIAGWYNMETVK